MTSELGVCLNKMLLLSRRLLAGPEHRDLPPPLIPPLSPATNQVCQTTFSLSQGNGRLLSEKKDTEDVQSLKKKKGLHSPCSPTDLEHLCFSHPMWMLCKCQRLVFGV